jgi:hypothetical protein
MRTPDSVRGNTKVTIAAALLSLALTAGVGASAFRQVGALRLRTIRSREPQRLYVVAYADRTDLTYGSVLEMEKAHRQYISGWMFSSFGINVVIGRLFNEK